MNHYFRYIAGVLFCAALSGNAVAHELQENRATLVLREGRHITLTLWVGYSDMLHRAMGAPSPKAKFLTQHAAMPASAFEKALAGTHRTLQDHIQIRQKDGQLIPIQGCHWPAAANVQAQLRERLMQSMVAATPRDHEEPLQVQCELQAGQSVRAVSVGFPVALGRVLVVAYQPRQRWVEGGSKGEILGF